MDAGDAARARCAELIAAILAAAAPAALAQAQTQVQAPAGTPSADTSTVTAPRGPSFAPDGTVRVPAFALPPSELSSREARAQQAQRARMPVALATPVEPDIAVRRAQLNAAMAPRIARMQALYPVEIADSVLGGVRAKVITPKGRPHDPKRVLINLHGSAFSLCWDACALVESIPIAALGGYKVIAVDYRMAPEHRHPAGIEDVAAVYRALLGQYRARNIGFFGCSAGGNLAAQAAAYLPAKGLPQAGAIGIFGAGAIRFQTGDSAYIAGYADGTFPPPPAHGGPAADLTRGYFDGADYADPLISPALDPQTIGRFPPTLVITGTRAMDLSPAIVTNSALLRAGVASTLIVGEAMGHCYMYQPDLPESRDAYAAIVAHFKRNLGAPARR
ncbi:alpha/beta hydrolase fold domain-containing protein [Novosphingobium piscinae]|uniref:Alpha/beta hydrolase n=1 Tax=Novosphingobium piscinae TaxID=1507448 RepID=A0A7X1KNV0_9SPHN|nr:alpha/beta hydrolase [Novosphingobium piscinae]MBC2667740.1 alpha/beta hydrolase [Novosphingobium piscinae]